jgi:glucokinase
MISSALPTTLVNDFEAVAHAVSRLPDDDFIHLAGPDIPLASDGTISVIGPGTGLGVAHLWREGGASSGKARVQATEGGHIDFAPLDPIEDSILARLRKSHRRVSVERVVSGPGIVAIYQALAAMENRTAGELDDITIWTKGTSGEDSLCAAAVDRFCLSLGSVAGDIALAQGGFGGVVIAGGLGYRIRSTLKSSGFAQRFTLKGRYENLMASIPVKIVTHAQPGLLGAAAAFQTKYL